MYRSTARTLVLFLALLLMASLPAGCGSTLPSAAEAIPSPTPAPGMPNPAAEAEAAGACGGCTQGDGACAQCGAAATACPGCTQGDGACAQCGAATTECPGCTQGDGACAQCGAATTECQGCAQGDGACAQCGAATTECQGCTPEAVPCTNCAAAHDTTLSLFATADFSGAGVCALCHEGLSDQAGADVSLTTTWRSTMMANAAKDPFWQAMVSAEVARMPALQSVIEAKCVLCHMPMAETQAEADGQPVAAQDGGFFDAAHPLHQAAMDGVSCTLCHQVADEALGSRESFSAGYTIDTSTEPPDRAVYGPYQDPFAHPMRMHTGFSPLFGAHTGQAELCATCHELYTPYVDAQGSVLGEFPEQTPYTEWQNSAYSGAMPCQACHMPQAKGGVVISTMPGRLGPREPFFRHTFVGGNALMLDVLEGAAAELEVTAEAAHFEATRALVVEQMGNRTATLTLESAALADGTLTARLSVAQMAGHKFPTSFPSRRAWLHVTVTDAAGQVVFESGARQAAGTIAGNAADADPTAFEPHYDVITAPDQVQIYESILGNSDGEVTYTLLRAAQYLKDNRLLPAGAEKAALPADVAVHGEAAGDPNFAGGSDLVTYQVHVAGASGPFTLSAELLYEPLSYGFVREMQAAGTELAERFGGYYSAADKSPLVVATIKPAAVK